MELKTSPRTLILALLYVKGKNKEEEPIEGITRLEKMMFILTNKHFTDIFKELNYKADNFGPFSDRLVDQIENLVDLKLIERKSGVSSELADEFLYSSNVNIPDRFELTKYGELLAKKYFENLNKDEKNNIIEIKKTFNSIPLDNLLYYVYNNISSDYLEKSKIKDKYLTNS